MIVFSDDSGYLNSLKVIVTNNLGHPESVI